MQYSNDKKVKFYIEQLRLEELSDLQRDGIYLITGEESEMTYFQVEELFNTSDWLEGVIVDVDDIIDYLNKKYSNKPFFEYLKIQLSELKKKGIYAVDLDSDYDILKTYTYDQYLDYVKSYYEDICDSDEEYSSNVSFETFLEDYTDENISLIDDLLQCDFIDC